MSGQRPVIVVTMGDPAGVGPEVVAKAVAEEEVQDVCRPLVVGAPSILAEALGSAGWRLRVVETAARVEGEGGTLDVLPVHDVTRGQAPLAQVTAEAGRASMEAVVRAIELTAAGEVAAMATAPINKGAWRLAGYDEIDHQGVLKRMTGAAEVATMLVSGGLRCVHLTTHHALREACDAVRYDAVLSRLRLTDRSFRRWGFSTPRIGVAALNPHGGDGGLLGREEIEEIEPAVKAARAEGIDAAGPVPADAVFHQAINGRFDVVLAMHHDQGHIPVKTHGFEESVSVNVGLPIVRTSVDHGTAFDIAGKGIADHRSMVEAIKVAVSLATRSSLSPS